MTVADSAICLIFILNSFFHSLSLTSLLSLLFFLFFRLYTTSLFYIHPPYFVFQPSFCILFLFCIFHFLFLFTLPLFYSLSFCLCLSYIPRLFHIPSRSLSLNPYHLFLYTVFVIPPLHFFSIPLSPVSFIFLPSPLFSLIRTFPPVPTFPRELSSPFSFHSLFPPVLIFPIPFILPPSILVFASVPTPST